MLSEYNSSERGGAGARARLSASSRAPGYTRRCVGVYGFSVFHLHGFFLFLFHFSLPLSLPPALSLFLSVFFSFILPLFQLPRFSPPLSLLYIPVAALLLPFSSHFSSLSLFLQLLLPSPRFPSFLSLFLSFSPCFYSSYTSLPAAASLSPSRSSPLSLCLRLPPAGFIQATFFLRAAVFPCLFPRSRGGSRFSPFCSRRLAFPSPLSAPAPGDPAAF